MTRQVLSGATVCLFLSLLLVAQEPRPGDPIQRITAAFDQHSIVMLGEIHESRQQWELLEHLIASPGFQATVNDIVMEFGNSRYQSIVDAYIDGGNVPFDEVQKAWRDVSGALGAVSPIYGRFYAAVRTVNNKLPKGHHLRILLGDPPVDWSRVQSREDLGPFISYRDEHYAGVVRYEVLAKKRKALLIMGLEHFRRLSGRPAFIENSLLAAGAKLYIVLPGSNVVGGFDDVDARFEQWPGPWLSEMKGNWIGGLPLVGVRGGQGAWADTADAYLYLGPRDKLTRIPPRRLVGTAYGKEIERRLRIVLKTVPDFIPKSSELPLYERTSAPPSSGPSPPKPQ